MELQESRLLEILRYQSTAWETENGVAFAEQLCNSAEYETVSSSSLRAPAILPELALGIRNGAPTEPSHVGNSFNKTKPH
jgi:hypothetical protein